MLFNVLLSSPEEITRNTSYALTYPPCSKKKKNAPKLKI